MTKPISITLQEDLVRWTETQAKEARDSVSRYINRVLESHREKVEKARKPKR